MHAQSQDAKTPRENTAHSLLTPTPPPADLVQRVLNLFGDTGFYAELCDLFFFSSFAGQGRPSFREYSKSRPFGNTSRECRQFATDLLELLADTLGVDENDAVMQYHLREPADDDNHTGIPSLALQPAVEKSRRALKTAGLEGAALVQAVSEQVVTTFGQEMVERALGDLGQLKKYLEDRTSEEQRAHSAEELSDEELSDEQEDDECDESQTDLIISDVYFALRDLSLHCDVDKTDEERLAALEEIINDATEMVAALRRGEMVIAVEQSERAGKGGAR